MPLGYLLALALSRQAGRLLPALLGALIAAGISFSVEAVQTWLPTRVASNLDLACNIAAPARRALPPGAAGRARSSGWPVPSAAWSP